MKSLALTSRTLLATAILVAVVAAVFGVLVLALSSVRDATSAEARAKEVTASSLAVENLVIELEAASRGLAITGSRRFLQPWTAAQDKLPAELAEFERLAEGNPEQERRARQISFLIRSYVKEYSAPLVVIGQENPQAARSTVAEGEGRRRTDEIRSNFARFLEVEDALAEESASTADKRTDRAIALAVAGLVALSVCAAAFGWYLARMVAQPVREVAEGSSRLASGDYTVRLPGRGGPREVAELRSAFNAMAEQLERQHAELEAQNEELRKSERLKSELVNIVSHELRTPLASVLGFTSLLTRRDLEPERRQRYLQIIDEQGRRLASLLDDFLDVQQLEEGRLSLSDDVVDMGSLLDEQAQLYTAQSDEHTLQLTLEDGPLSVRGDRNRLSQVVGNLLSNAIKYSPAGGRVEILGERQNGAVRVSVTDEGVGIPPEYRDRIFTKFFRGEAAASGIQGSGLGLAFARAVVEAHGGRIDFRSSSGQGTTFWLELPPASPASPTEGRETP